MQEDPTIRVVEGTETQELTDPVEHLRQFVAERYPNAPGETVEELVESCMRIMNTKPVNFNMPEPMEMIGLEGSEIIAILNASVSFVANGMPGQVKQLGIIRDETKKSAILHPGIPQQQSQGEYKLVLVMDWPNRITPASVIPSN